MARRRGAALWAGAGLLLAVTFVAALRLGALQGDVGAGALRDEPAPELRGIAGWINSEPLSIRGLRGRVVLIDFWTYSCVNCIRTFPALRALYARYRTSGLEIIGVHSPEFAFERERANVVAAVRRYRLAHPVALDSDMRTWRAYRNRFWPRVYLVDARGRIRFDHVGEGGDALIERRLRELLSEAGRGPLPAPIGFDEPAFDPRLTPEIYAGYERGVTLANPEGYRPDRTVAYGEPDAATVREAGTDGAFFLAGRWLVAAEFARAASPGARVVLPFFARDVFLVGSGRGDVGVLLDGHPLPPGASGPDVRSGSVRLEGARLYAVVRLPRAGPHVLVLEAPAQFSLYTFTFG